MIQLPWMKFVQQWFGTTAQAVTSMDKWFVTLKLHLVTESLGPFLQAYKVSIKILSLNAANIWFAFLKITTTIVSQSLFSKMDVFRVFCSMPWPNSSLENIYQDNLPHILLQDCQVDPLLQMFTSICFSSCYRILNHKGYLGGGYTKKEPTVTGGSILSNFKQVNLPS